MRTNAAMNAELTVLDRRSKPLPEGLSHILKEGFETTNGTVLLSAFSKANRHVKIDQFHDLTGYECFINSFHVEDFALRDCLSHALSFALCCIRMWNETSSNEVLRVIVSSHDSDAIVRLHKVRAGEEWLAANLEGYDEAILQVDSTDDGFSLPN